MTSPGGFIGGVMPSNIISHPAVPRYRSLAEALARLRLAEREGIGAEEVDHVLHQVSEMTVDGLPIIDRVRSTPNNQPFAYRLSDHSRRRLDHRLKPRNTPECRESLIIDWAQSRGRISSTEAADLTGLTVSHTGRLLSSLAEDGLLTGRRPRKRGRGFHYLPADHN